MKKVVFILLVVLLLLVAVSAVTHATPPTPEKTLLPLVNACTNVGPAFCNPPEPGNDNEAPDAVGMVSFNPIPVDRDVLRVIVKMSLPDTLHQVFLCPGDGNFGPGQGGYVGCTWLGEFDTDATGSGKFILDYPGEFLPDWRVVNINTPATGTLLSSVDSIQ